MKQKPIALLWIAVFALRGAGEPLRAQTRPACKGCAVSPHAERVGCSGLRCAQRRRLAPAVAPQAERDARAECTKSGGRGSRVVAAAENGCGALGFCAGVAGSRRYWGAFPASGATLGQAVDTALTNCRKQAKRPEACGVRLTFCADGSHKQ